MFLAAQKLSGSWQDYGLFLVETLVVLALIALGALVFVRLMERGFRRGKRGERMRVIERLVLTPKHSLYIVKVDSETLLISASERSTELLKNLGALPESTSAVDSKRLVRL
jgi:flagellar biogenesis protein FliO